MIYSKLVADAMARLYKRGLVELKGGNMSIRVAIGDRDVVLVTPSGAAKDSIDPNDVAAVMLDGQVIYGRPSSEYRLHLEIYKRIGDARAVVHAHNTFATVLREGGLPLEPFAGEAFNTCISWIEYRPAGSRELAEAVASKLAETGCRVAVMERHGVVSIGVGPDPRRALLDAIELIEAVETAALRALAVLASAPLLLYRG